MEQGYKDVRDPNGGSEDAPRPTTPTRTPAAGDENGHTPFAGRRALLLCLGLLLLLEVGAARREWVWRVDPRRPVGILLAVEDRIIEAAEDPRVVALGSSVMRDALLPRAFERAAALPSGSVLNTSLPNATPFDFVLLYERNRAPLARARVLLVGVEDWYFYEEVGIPERYHRWASLSERFTDYRGRARLPLLVSWAWKTYAARQALAPAGIVAALRGERPEVIGADGRTRWRPEEQALGAQSFDLRPYEARLRGRVWHERPVRYLSELLALAREDGVPAVLVRMPMRAAAFSLRAQVDPGAEQRLQQALVAAVGETGAVVLDLPVGVDAGLQERHFLDERHLGTEGAEVFTRYLAGWVGERFDVR